MQKKIITRNNVAEVLASNTAGVKFANKSLNRQFEKNKKRAERERMLRENFRKKAAKEQRADEVMTADLSKESDENLISAVIALGVTVADLLEGNVSIERALRLKSEAEKIIAERAQRKLLAASVSL